MTYYPTVDAVATAWLKTLAGLPPNGVATSLPADPAAWSELGFVQVQSVGGLPTVHTPLRHPIVQVDCWANALNAQTPPWGKAGHLVELILLGTFFRDPVTVTPARGNYYPACVRSVYPVEEPRRFRDDDAGFARYTMDLCINYTVDT